MTKTKEKESPIHIYGPVPSRRLGFSLGIDILPYKTCTLDCIYCQLGPTPKKTVQQKEHFSSDIVLAQINKTLSSGQRIDYITFSGSGEPTLNTTLGKLIREIKKITDIPVAVLTNSTLLTKARVREALQAADLVVPSLDAATQEEFIAVNRPHSSLKIEDIIVGLKIFRQEFKGQIWLEIMLVKGKNDSPNHLNKLKAAVREIQPDRIQLNTVIRPPAEQFARALSLKDLEKIKKAFGKKCEIIADFAQMNQFPQSQDIERKILSMIQRRPVTLSDISASLGKHRDEVLKYLNILISNGKIKPLTHKGKTYYEPSSAGNSHK
ncbi:MAG: radical SAM protein [Candidatus Aminicenantes bacterium]|nr:radical SAM protein [Candidatus Aminicenantes bacterium]